MIGLCHVCLTSGVPLFITKHKTHCVNCKDRDVRSQKEEEKKEEIKLQFEDLPQESLEKRIKTITQIVDELQEIAFVKWMKNERISEPLIDRLEEG